MPAPLRSSLAALWVACIAGVVVIVLLSSGWTGWKTFAIAGVIGLLIGIPAGIWSASHIKREDPGWPPERLQDEKTRPPWS